MTCGFSGNPDVYGVGIRIGYYTQALAMWLANFFLLREAAGLRAVNNLFLFAMLVVALIYAFNASSTYAVEAFLLLHISLSMGFVGIMQSTRYSTRHLKISGDRLVARTIIINAWMLLNICFWWVGLDSMLKTPCGTHAFYLVETNLYGWMRMALKVLSLTLFTWRTVGWTTHDARVGIRDISMRSTRATFIDSAAQSRHDQTQGYSSHSFKESENALEIVRGQSLKAVTFAGVAAMVPHCSKSNRRFTWPGCKGVNQCCMTAGAERGTYLRSSLKRAAGENAAPSERLSTSTYAFFERVYEAEKYLKDALSVYPPKVPEPTKTGPVHLFRGRFQIRVPKPESGYDPQTPPYLDCLRRTVTAAWTGCPPLCLRICLAIHITALQQHSTLRWPRVVEQMARLNAKSQPPDWHTLTIASDISLSQMPLVITPRIWTIMAAETLAMIVFLVVQVELTVAWNSISGLSSLSTLGQLIPFILGVGGLLKVVWQKWKLVRKGSKEEATVQDHTSPYKEAMETYLTWKKDRQKDRSLPISCA